VAAWDVAGIASLLVTVLMIQAVVGIVSLLVGRLYAQAACAGCVLRCMMEDGSLRATQPKS
jgi:hypothetical protein